MSTLAVECFMGGMRRGVRRLRTDRISSKVRRLLKPKPSDSRPCVPHIKQSLPGSL